MKGLSIETEACNFLILGKKGSGKSMTGWAVVQSQHLEGGRPAYMFMCPKPELLTKIPFKVQNLTRLSQLFHLRDSVCIIDEANLFFDVKSKQINDDLKQLLQLSRQNNTTFIFVVHNSYVFNRGLFGHIDVKVIKEVSEDHWELERPHMKKMYRSVRVAGQENMYVDCSEFKGYAVTEKLDWYDDEFSTMFKATNKPRTLFKVGIKEITSRVLPIAPLMTKIRTRIVNQIDDECEDVRQDASVCDKLKGGEKK